MPHHTPERRCVACGRRAPKVELARFVTADAPDGRRLERDRRGHLPGRGMYICPNRGCFDRALERRAFQRGARLGRGEGLDVDPGLGNEFDA